jgi:hypothetical protein
VAGGEEIKLQAAAAAAARNGCVFNTCFEKVTKATRTQSITHSTAAFACRRGILCFYFI